MGFCFEFIHWFVKFRVRNSLGSLASLSKRTAPLQHTCPWISKPFSSNINKQNLEGFLHSRSSRRAVKICTAGNSHSAAKPLSEAKDERGEECPVNKSTGAKPTRAGKVLGWRESGWNMKTVVGSLRVRGIFASLAGQVGNKPLRETGYFAV